MVVGHDCPDWKSVGDSGFARSLHCAMCGKLHWSPLRHVLRSANSKQNGFDAGFLGFARAETLRRESPPAVDALEDL
eukprot:5026891-Pyramimonas_sp.AAC.1